MWVLYQPFNLIYSTELVNFRQLLGNSVNRIYRLNYKFCPQMPRLVYNYCSTSTHLLHCHWTFYRNERRRSRRWNPAAADEYSIELSIFEQNVYHNVWMGDRGRYSVCYNFAITCDWVPWSRSHNELSNKQLFSWHKYDNKDVCLAVFTVLPLVSALLQTWTVPRPSVFFILCTAILYSLSYFGAFAELRHGAISFAIYVRPPGTRRLPPDGYWLYLIFE